MKRGPKIRDPEVVLHEKYIPEPNSGCWLWLGEINQAGYGRIPNGKKRIAAHRLSLQISTGVDRPELEACHRCDVPGCVNPDHLFWGTAQENALDAVAKGRMIGKFNLRKRYCPKGHEYTDDNTYVAHRSRNGRTYRSCKVCHTERERCRRSGGLFCAIVDTSPGDLPSSVA